MEQRYIMALELIKGYIEAETYPDKNTIKMMCETALKVEEVEGNSDE